MIYPALVAFLLYDIWRTWHAWMVLPLPLHAQFGQQTRLLEGLDATVGFLGSVAPLLLCALPIAWLGFTQRRSFLPAVAAFAVLLLLSAVTPPGGADLHRLPLPFLPTIMLGAGLGLAWMLRRIPTGWITPAVLLLLLSYFLWQTDRFAFVRPMAIERGRLVRNGLVLLGRALADVDSSGGSTVALGGFAATAYYSGWRVIDTHGTHDPAIALATTKGMYDPALVLKDQPELLITSSRRPKVFDAVGPMDSLLTNSAMRSGYRRLGAVRVTDSLYLWLFSSEAANARTIVAAVERRTAPLLH
jgi:hypothetical protein